HEPGHGDGDEAVSLEALAESHLRPFYLPRVSLSRKRERVGVRGVDPAGIGRKLVGFRAIWVLVRRSPERVLPASPDAGSTRDRRTLAELTELSSDRSARMRIAVISMYTFPTAPLVQHAAGGMNVYGLEVWRGFVD